MKITIEIDDDEVRRILSTVIVAPPSETQTPVADTAKLLTVAEVAARLGISRTQTYHLIHRGDIRSLTIGRSRRVAPAALAAFIAAPGDNATSGFQMAPPLRSTTDVRTPHHVTAPEPKPRVVRAKAPRPPVDLTPQKRSSDSTWRLSDEELDEALLSMLEKGWPADVIDQIRVDHLAGVTRINTLTIKEAAMYLGLSRYGIEKLISDGKLRLFTAEPTYTNEKPSKLIPAKDLVALGGRLPGA